MPIAAFSDTVVRSKVMDRMTIYAASALVAWVLVATAALA